MFYNNGRRDSEVWWRVSGFYSNFRMNFTFHIWKNVGHLNILKYLEMQNFDVERVLESTGLEGVTPGNYSLEFNFVSF